MKYILYILILFTSGVFSQTNTAQYWINLFPTVYNINEVGGQTEREALFARSIAGTGDNNAIYIQSETVRGLVSNVINTLNKDYLNDIIEVFDNNVSTATLNVSPYNDSYLSWPANGGQEPLQEVKLFREYSRLLYYMKDSPTLRASMNTRKGVTYQNFYDECLAFMETHIWDKWMTRAVEQMYNGGVDKDIRAATFALYLWKITGKAEYKTKLDAANFVGNHIGNTIGGNLRAHLETNTADPNAWQWDRLYNHAVSASYPQNGNTAVNDISHAVAVPLHMAADHELNGYWTLADLQKMAPTLEVMWERTMVGNESWTFMDGTSGGLDNNPHFSGWADIGKFDAALQTRLESHPLDYFQSNRDASNFVGMMLDNINYVAGNRLLPESEVPTGTPTVILNTLKAFPDLWGENADQILGASTNAIKFFITSLADTNTATFVPATATEEAHYTGTFRGALLLTGQIHRHIIPRVSGNIILNSDIIVRTANANFTYHGHLAPQGGLTITNNNVVHYQSIQQVYRFYRGRYGINSVLGSDDALSMRGSTYHAIDHSSFGQAADEAMSMIGIQDAFSTFIWQNNLFTEGRSGHNTGSIIGQTTLNTTDNWDVIGTTHNNVWAGVTHRTPNMAGNSATRITSRNNIAYDWLYRLTNVVGAPTVDVSFNYYKLGPNSTSSSVTTRVSKLNIHQELSSSGWPSPPLIHTEGNIIPTILDSPTADNKLIWDYSNGSGGGALPDNLFTATPIPIDAIVGYEPTSAIESYNRNVIGREVGANRTTDQNGNVVIGHDSFDAYYLDAVENGTTAYMGENNWFHPSIASNTPYTDTNNNGIYDGFESAHGINSSSDVILNWDFGTYKVINNAGYDAFEIWSAYIAGDFDRLPKVGVSITLPIEFEKQIRTILMRRIE